MVASANEGLITALNLQRDPRRLLGLTDYKLIEFAKICSAWELEADSLEQTTKLQ